MNERRPAWQLILIGAIAVALGLALFPVLRLAAIAVVGFVRGFLGAPP